LYAEVLRQPGLFEQLKRKGGSMQVYRLGPKSGNTSDRNWEATTLKDECWVFAESEADAREKVALATGMGARFQPGATIPQSPWMNRDLTDCVPDNAPGRQPPSGFILTASRKIPFRGQRPSPKAAVSERRSRALHRHHYEGEYLRWRNN
jgi:hypothetical protein